MRRSATLLACLAALCYAAPAHGGRFAQLIAASALETRPVPRPAPTPIADKCENCDGTGRVGDGTIEKPCPVCHGTGKHVGSAPLKPSHVVKWVTPEEAARSPKPNHWFLTDSACVACERELQAMSSERNVEWSDLFDNVAVDRFAGETPAYPQDAFTTDDYPQPGSRWKRFTPGWGPDKTPEDLQRRFAEAWRAVGPQQREDRHGENSSVRDDTSRRLRAGAE